MALSVLAPWRGGSGSERIGSVSRVLAWAVAVATVVAAVGFVVLAFVGLSRGALEGREAAVAPLFLVGVLAPTLVGLFLALRQPGEPRRVDPVARRAVGRGRAGGERARGAGAPRGPRLVARAVGGDRRRTVAGAVHLAARAGVRVPGRRAALAALAAGGAGGVRDLRADRGAADPVRGAREPVRAGAESAAGAARRVGRADLLGVLVRVVGLAVRRARRRSGRATGRATTCCAARCSGWPTGRC